MRLIAAILGMLLLAAATPARDWTATVNADPAGAWTIGNPAAPVKLVEWASYTCPHCAHFAEASQTELEGKMIRSGSTSLTVRHLIRDPLDLTAVAIARCGGPRGFLRRHHAIFEAQEKWLNQGVTFVQQNGAELDKLARPAAFRRIADGSGLTTIGRAAGLTAPQIAACFTPAALAALTRLGDPPAEVTGTPTFYLNGKLVSGVDWTGLEPMLKGAGAH